MNRQERRALVHKERKLARKLGFPAAQTTEPKSEPTPAPIPEETTITPPFTIPEPPAPFPPPLSAISPARLRCQPRQRPKIPRPPPAALASPSPSPKQDGPRIGPSQRRLPTPAQRRRRWLRSVKSLTRR